MRGSSDGPRRGVRTALVLWILAVVALTTAPYVLLAVDAGGFAPEDSRYTWILPPYPEDGLGYTAWVEQAAAGSWLFKVKYTQIPHRGVLFHPFFLLVGWLSAVSGWSAGFALFVARILAVVVFLLVLYRFSGRYLREPAERISGLALVSFSSGLGLRALSDGQPSADLWMPEINTLWSMTWNPVFVVALTLMLGAIALIDTASSDDTRRNRMYLGAGALTALLAFTHAYDVVVVVVVVVTISAIRLGRRMVVPLASFGALALPAIAIQGFIAMHHPVLSAHGEAGRMTSPSLTSYAAAMGLPGALAVYGVWRVARTGGAARFLPLFVWIGASVALAYAPVWFQRKMIMGIHVPVCLVAAVGLCDVARRLSFGRKTVFAGVAAALVVVSSLAHVRTVRSTIEDVRSDPSAYYRSAGLDRALGFLERHTAPDDVVLAHYYAARHVPGRSGNTVTLGHWAQSVDLRNHMRWLGELFSPASRPTDAERQQALLDSPIRYVLIGPQMRREWMHGKVPAWLEQIGETVYQDDGFRILRITRAAPGQPPDDSSR